MKDLTQGSVLRHVVTMSAPVFAFMIVQSLYLLVDLYFVAQLGDLAVAGVSIGGNAGLITIALVQVLSVGITALISHAVGRRDPADANLVFNQSITLSMLCAVLFLVAGYFFARRYVQSLAADAATLAAGVEYLHWFMPALALQFALSVVASALRGTGIIQPTMFVHVISVIINIILAPILISGWGTGHPMGVAGAGLSSSLAAAVAVLLLWLYFFHWKHYVSLKVCLLWPPRLLQWKRILNVGLPTGGEMVLMFVYTGVTYWAIRDFGVTAQAGFSVGSRVVQVLLLPAAAISFAAGPIVGQNFGARNGLRVKNAFRAVAILNTIVMIAITLFLQFFPDWLMRAFTKEADVIAVGVLFLQLVSIGFVARGLIYTCTSLFQGLGNTFPALISSAASLAIFTTLAIWMSNWSGFRIEHVWYLSISTVTLQAVIGVMLVRLEMRRCLVESNLSAPAFHVSP